MRHRTERHLLGLLWLAAVLAWPARADVPELMSYQGVLTLPNGWNPQDGAYSLRFRILDDQEAVHYEETLTVIVRAGLYGVLLGGSGSTTLSSAFADHPRFLEVEILSGAEPGITNVVLEPRQRISPVPFALTAKRAEATVGPAESIPTNMIVLWDQPTGCGGVPDQCPCGWSEATEFRGRTARGADTAERWPDLPDDPGVTKGAPQDAGKFGNALTAAEAPEHSHVSAAAGAHNNHSLNLDVPLGGTVAVDFQISGEWGTDSLEASGPGGDHTHTATDSGGGAPHAHAARRTFFCRRM